MTLTNTPLRALSIRQPWAHSIVHGTKRVENRNWETAFRGPFLIHAAKGMTRDEFDVWTDTILTGDIRWPGLRGRVWRPSDFADERGGIVGVATLVRTFRHRENCPEDQLPWFFGRVGFLLDDVRPIPFIPCKGALGFFKVDAAIEAETRRALDAA